MRTRIAAVDGLVAPLALFVSFYVATLLALVWGPVALGSWGTVLAAAIASAGAVVLWEGGRWRLGIAVGPATAVADFISGIAFGSILVAACAAAIVLTTDIHHVRGNGFPWLEIAAVYIPAAIHEELLFRGYPLQKLMLRNRNLAILVTAFIFALLHARNDGVTLLALSNVFLGGILLGVAYGRRLNLWFPFGLHLAWNVMAGPLLGHEVSGFAPAMSLFVEAGGGPDWLTGGRFGIEASVWMTVAECTGIAILTLWPRAKGEGAARGMTPLE